MKTKLLSVLIIVTVIFHTVPLFAADPDHVERHKDSVERERVQITQDEYDRKIKSANTVMLTGAIVGGVGLAAVATGLAIALTGQRNWNGFGRGMKGAVVASIGGAVMIGGGITAAVGGVKKSHVKKKYYTLYPMIDPKQDLYGVNFSVSF